METGEGEANPGSECEVACVKGERPSKEGDMESPLPCPLHFTPHPRPVITSVSSQPLPVGRSGSRSFAGSRGCKEGCAGAGGLPAPLGPKHQGAPEGQGLGHQGQGRGEVMEEEALADPPHLEKMLKPGLAHPVTSLVPLACRPQRMETSIPHSVNPRGLPHTDGGLLGVRVLLPPPSASGTNSSLLH